MKLLILGGTLFLGRALVEAALARSHEVTVFHRGRHRKEPIPGVESLLGDRDGRLDALAGREWDAVVDTSGYVPRLVRASAELLAERVRRYVFVSSISVYADFSRPTPEDAALATMPESEQEEVTGATYGPLKVLCEKAVAETLPERALIVRPGLIVGPHDPDQSLHLLDGPGRARRRGACAWVAGGAGPVHRCARSRSMVGEDDRARGGRHVQRDRA
jgi:2'-hydroxyisoflavone reductase